MTWLVWIVTIPIAYAALSWIQAQRRNARRPPGPPGLPLIGNVLSIPKDNQWIVWDRWRKAYGDVVYFKILGSENLILSSYEAASELLDTRGLIYSDRPRAVMAGELVGWNRGLGYSSGPPNPRFRELRRLFQVFIGPRACDAQELQVVQEEEMSRLLGKLFGSPENFMTHTRDSTAAVLLRLAYGYNPNQAHGDSLSLVKIVQDAMDGFSVASEPGWWVDSFPLLKHLPWAPFLNAARQMREDLERLYKIPFAFVKREREKGTAEISFISSFFDNKDGEETPQDEDLINAAAASLYSGGAETTVSSLDSYFLAMTHFPQIQTKAQSIIDDYMQSTRLSSSSNSSSTGRRQFPTISDRPNLPYIEAMVYEILRWNPSVPLGLPHVVTQDDVYKGFEIKKGTVVWANIWSILHDETIFPDPTRFKPERYLGEQGQVARNSKQVLAVKTAFGFGRRICPGLYLAENSVFLAIATLSFTFDILPHESGLPDIRYDGFISHPKPFKCRIQPRSDGIVQLIKEAIQKLH